MGLSLKRQKHASKSNSVFVWIGERYSVCVCESEWERERERGSADKLTTY